ncbi:MAG: Maf family protein [Clostridia bacterium]|nr:Maf family protein [Clostridia bacterium]
MQYVLASTSPRRKELLKQLISDFEIISPDVDESYAHILGCEQLVCDLAERKCAAVFAKNPQKTVIAADTVVVYGGRVLGKPKSENDAVQTLKTLSGREHSVITGVCVQSPYNKVVGFNKTTVKFNILSDEFIKNYVKGGSPMDKAGSYGIQDKGVVCGYAGSYSNVVGLPLGLTRELLEKAEKHQ